VHGFQEQSDAQLLLLFHRPRLGGPVVIPTLQVGEVRQAQGVYNSGLAGIRINGQDVVEDVQAYHSTAVLPNVQDALQLSASHFAITRWRRAENIRLQGAKSTATILVLLVLIPLLVESSMLAHGIVEMSIWPRGLALAHVKNGVKESLPHSELFEKSTLSRQISGDARIDQHVDKALLEMALTQVFLRLTAPQ